MARTSLDRSQLASYGQNGSRKRDAHPQSNAHRTVRGNYREASQITGPLKEAPEGPIQVQFRSVLTERQRFWLALQILVNVICSLTFLALLVLPRHFPTNDDPFGTFGSVISAVAFGLVVLLETFRLFQNSTLWFFAWEMRDPIPFIPEPGLRIAVLTTIVPSKEPIELAAVTLDAMRRLDYDGLVDVWVLDEDDDPRVRTLAADLGVHHFSRNGQPEYNQPSGPFRAGRKSGNHNAWRMAHEHQYDIVAQMDPDHVPLPEFLNRTVGYFRDRDVAFVVAPQVYGNLEESFVTNGAADQAYLFHGVVQRGGNYLDAPLLIGTNHLYRTSAWQQIGGYQDSVIEDHLTSLYVHQAVNPQTRNHWKGIYTPDVLSIGEGPRSWTDYFNQQYRWSFGIWEIVLNHSRRILGRMPRRRAMSYLCLEFFYPSIAILWVLGTLITASYLVFGVTAVDIAPVPWLSAWLPTVLLQYLLFVYLRRFNLAQHERSGTGMIGIVLSLACGPIYVVAALSALLRRPYTYAVTAKSDLASRDSRDTFRLHFLLVAAAVLALATSVIQNNDHWSLRLWALFFLICFSLPLVGHAAVTARKKRPNEQPSRAMSSSETELENVAIPTRLVIDLTGDDSSHGTQIDLFDNRLRDEPGTSTE